MVSKASERVYGWLSTKVTGPGTSMGPMMGLPIFWAKLLMTLMNGASLYWSMMSRGSCADGSARGA